MKHLRIKKGIMICLMVVLATLIFTLIVMGLWNSILPAVMGVKAITFMQALGILVLSKILFGGFKGGWRGQNCKNTMKEKWETMTPAQREKFKAEWRNRCGGRWGMRPQNDTADKTVV